MYDYFVELKPKLFPLGILPVFCPQNEAELDTFINALLPTPVRVIEITLRNDLAYRAIERIKTVDPDFTVGAGTVMTKESLCSAKAHGADFLVSPGYRTPLLTLAKEENIPFLPGCTTPSEIQTAFFQGYRTLKYFPAACAGGVASLSLYKGAFADVCFIPTGGIHLNNLESYLQLPNVVACGGSYMLPKTMLERSDSDGITQTILSCLTHRKGETL